MSPLLRCSLCILLTSFLTLVPVSAKGNWPGLQRHKREWIIAPRQLRENFDYTGYKSIATIRSDKMNSTTIFYYLSGHGVELAPEGVFTVERNTGLVRVNSILDREEMAVYNLKGSATYANGSQAEKIIDLKITVLDENDNYPVVKADQVGTVEESSAAGTVVMRLIATDTDEINTLHTKLHYSIVEQSNTAKMFSINSKTGEIMVLQNTLDREKQDSYKLMVKVSDMDGRGGGNIGTGEVDIQILDINDNVPTLEKESYEGSVEENTFNTEVMRIQAIDQDMIHTENWMAVYEIVSGNEGGYFTITTDSKTNEGVIMINKALNYEELKALNIAVAVSNKAAYNFGSSGSMTGAGTSKAYPILINVLNQKEPPRFKPNVKVVTISEDQSSISLNKVITNYAAIDSDTLQTATNVRYVKLRDDGNWLIIDEKTADIKLNKMPDRESKLLVNGTYYAEIICVTKDSPSHTATGTIAIQVEDFNDHCPELIDTTQTMCHGDNAITVTAVDGDDQPNSAPFEFSVIQDSNEEKWKVERLNDTSAILRHEGNLWPGVYKVVLDVKDQQGKSCDDVQTMDVIVCTCREDAKVCKDRTAKTADIGASGILLLLLGLLLLLLVPLLLLFCLCGGTGDFKPIPFDSKQQLISYHTEGQGEDKEVPLLTVPVEVGPVGTNNFHGFGGQGQGFGQQVVTDNSNQFNSQFSSFNGHGGMNYGHREEHLVSQYSAGAFDGMALSDQFLGEYYSSKSNHAAQQAQQNDGLLIYDTEGQGSLAGSVGCCSLLENDDDLAFLNDLGPKFKTLAGICQGTTLVTESVETGVSVSPPRPVSPIMPASTHTHVHTHTETTGDNVNINVNTSTESSTVVQEKIITEVQGSAKVQVQDNIVVSSPTLLVQQPTMYYAATPMYVVNPNPQMMLVSGGAQHAVGQVGQAGLTQGLVQVGGLQGSQGMVLVDRQVGMGGVTGQVAQGFSQGSGVVLVERQGGMGGVTGQVAQGFSQGSQGMVLVDRQGGMGGVTGQGTISRSRQVLLVENGSSGGEQYAQLPQGFVQTGHGSAVQGLEVAGKGMQVKTQSFSLGSHGSAVSNEDFSLKATPKLQGSKRVVVQQKKVSVTEKNIESSSRA